MYVRVSPTKKMLKFIGDRSVFVMNSYGVVMEEYQDPHLEEVTAANICDRKFTDTIHSLAEKLGATVRTTPKTLEKKWNFSKVIDNTPITFEMAEHLGVIGKNEDYKIVTLSEALDFLEKI